MELFRGIVYCTFLLVANYDDYEFVANPAFFTSI